MPFFFTFIYSGKFHWGQGFLFQQHPAHTVGHWADLLEQLLVEALIKSSLAAVKPERQALLLYIPPPPSYHEIEINIRHRIIIITLKITPSAFIIARLEQCPTNNGQQI